MKKLYFVTFRTWTGKNEFYLDADGLREMKNRRDVERIQEYYTGRVIYQNINRF